MRGTQTRAPGMGKFSRSISVSNPAVRLTGQVGYILTCTPSVPFIAAYIIVCIIFSGGVNYFVNHWLNLLVFIHNRWRYNF